MKSFLKKKFTSNRGSIELLFLILPTFISLMGAIMIFKGLKSVEKMKLRAEIYLCAQQYNDLTVDHYRDQIKLNQKIFALNKVALIDLLPKAAVIRKIAMKALKLKQEWNFKMYQKDIMKAPYCSKFSKAAMFLAYPFKNKGIILTRKSNLLQLRKNQWTIKITSKNLKTLNTYLQGKWQVNSNLKSSGNYSYQRKEILLLPSFLQH